MWPFKKSEPGPIIFLELAPFDALCTVEADDPPQLVTRPVQSYLCECDEQWLKLHVWDFDIEEHQDEWWPCWRVLSVKWQPAHFPEPVEE